eukprot:00802.XXX_528_903_1 [CDS] Oithona nana genome sequencing.
MIGNLKVLLLGIICLPWITCKSHSYSRFQLGNGPLIETKIGHGPPRAKSNLQQQGLTKRKILPMIYLKDFPNDANLRDSLIADDDGSIFRPTVAPSTPTPPKTYLPLR